MRRRRSVLAVGAGVALALAALPAGASTDPSYHRQWGLARIGAQKAWDRSTGIGVKIGIVDTGIDLRHEELSTKVVAHANCVGSLGDPTRCAGSAQDDHGHGTHVAGIAVAVKDNGIGVAGVAPAAKLVVAKVLDHYGRGTTADINAGIKWVVDHGAEVVNLSLGDRSTMVTSLLGLSHSLQDGVDYAWKRGAVPVVAAGNMNLFGLGLEASSNNGLHALVVGATGPDDRVTRYSTATGQARWALLAPGGAGNGNKDDDVYSTLWISGKQNGYGYLAGTSMAAPHVSGAVALLLAMGYEPLGAVQRLLETADNRVLCGWASPTCRGRLDVAKATASEVSEISPTGSGDDTGVASNTGAEEEAPG